MWVPRDCEQSGMRVAQGCECRGMGVPGGARGWGYPWAGISWGCEQCRLRVPRDGGIHGLGFPGDVAVRVMVPGLQTPWGPGYSGVQALVKAGTEVLGGCLCLAVPPELVGDPGGHPRVPSSHHWELGFPVDMGAMARELLLPVPGVLALLGDLGSDDFMALLRTNCYPGRENKQVYVSFSMESYWGCGEALPVFIHGLDFSTYLHGPIIPKSQ